METQCANPIWSYQAHEFHFSGCGTCILIIAKYSLKFSVTSHSSLICFMTIHLW